MRAPLPRNWRDLRIEARDDGGAAIVPAHATSPRSPYRAVNVVAPRAPRASLGWARWTARALVAGLVTVDVYSTTGMYTLYIGAAGAVVSLLVLLLALLVEGTSGARRHARLALGFVAATVVGAFFAVHDLARRERGAHVIIAAVERYHSDQHRYPPSLDALVPAYLPRVPTPGRLGPRSPRYVYSVTREGDAILSWQSAMLSHHEWWDFRRRRRGYDG